MAADAPTVWCFHPGQDAKPERFFEKRVFGMGWAPATDLSKLKERSDFNAAVAKAHPERAAKGPLSVSMAGGQLYKFVHEVQLGDVVVLPIARKGGIHIARVEGGYRYDRSSVPGFPHLRTVTWVKTLPKSDFEPATLRELGSVLSIFRVSRSAPVFIKAASS